MTDVLIIGGGVIGLSLAYELAGAGRSVRVIDRGDLGREASWAGAGILPPAPAREGLPAWEKLQALSYGLHQTWSRRLREETGIDNGLRVCGGLHIARRPGEAAALRADAAKWVDDGIDVRDLSPREVADSEPNLRGAADAGEIRAAFHLPDEAQIRNPRHLQALGQACRQRGVLLSEKTAALDFELAGDCVAKVITNKESIQPRQVCLTAGAWSDALAQRLGLELGIYPVRGQMVLYRCNEPPLQRIVDEGPRYLVPRDDGRVLVGSTEEDVGFENHTTEIAIAQLRQFAERLVPPLAASPVDKTWAGLRPHSRDGFPYIGRVPHLANCFVAAGHYRSGLYTSTGTAVLLRQLMCGEEPELDVETFGLDR